MIQGLSEYSGGSDSKPRSERGSLLLGSIIYLPSPLAQKTLIFSGFFGFSLKRAMF